MSDSQTNNKRIAKNTIYLYSRTFISIIVTLYTSRVFLNQLGFEDYGLYNLVGGVVALFSVMNTMLSSATQRYISIEIGNNNFSQLNKVFNISISIQVVLAICFLVLSEVGGVLLLKYYLNIPEGKEELAFIVFQLSIVTAILNLLRVPYNALIIAHEKMSFYAYGSIIEIVAKLIITLGLVLASNKLIFYSIALLIVTGLMTIVYWLYCKIKLSLTRFKLYSPKSNSEYKSLLSFSGWSLAGTSASVARDQGISFLFNSFYGVTLNAAMGIVVQISNVYSGLFLNLQSAFRPQVIQNSVSDKNRYFILINRCSFYSLVFMGATCIPLIMCCPQILHFWLGDIPPNTVELVQILMIKIIFASISQSVYLAVEARGKIRNVQIVTIILSFLSVAFAYTLLRCNVQPYWAFGVIVLMEIMMFIHRLSDAVRNGYLSLPTFMQYNLKPLTAILVMAITVTYFKYFINTWPITVLSIISFIPIYVIIIALVMNKGERKSVMNVLKSKFNH